LCRERRERRAVERKPAEKGSNGGRNGRKTVTFGQVLKKTARQNKVEMGRPLAANSGAEG